MENKKKIKLFMIVALLITLVLGGLVFVNTAFIPACMLWLSLFIFSICYYIKDNDKKIPLYSLFLIGVLLIIGALVYMIMRIV